MGLSLAAPFFGQVEVCRGSNNGVADGGGDAVAADLVALGAWGVGWGGACLFFRGRRVDVSGSLATNPAAWLSLVPVLDVGVLPLSAACGGGGLAVVDRPLKWWCAVVVVAGQLSIINNLTL